MEKFIEGKYYWVKADNDWEICKYKTGVDFDSKPKHKLEFTNGSIMTYKGTANESPIFTALKEIDYNPIERDVE